MEHRAIHLERLLLLLLLVAFSAFFSVDHAAASPSVGSDKNVQAYIVHLRQSAGIFFRSSIHREKWHMSILSKTVGDASSRVVYSYKNVITGFTAKLTEREVDVLRSHQEVVQVYPDKLIKLHTTRTPTFLSLNQPQGPWNRTNFGKGVIVGVVDGGFTPNHPSFSGDGLPPPPAKWKGRCEFNASICNNKVIGARVFLDGAAASKGGGSTRRPSPIDEDGHGTHVASVAAGWFVKDANVLGQGLGTAVGMAPLAHLAVYRVCDVDTCANSDILAGIDAAIEDGVDVISLSLGSHDQLPLDQNVIAIGSFTAVEKGVFVSCSAGNTGPQQSTVSNEAPWLLTVAASTIDRRFTVTVRLGNGLEVDGESVFQSNNTSTPSFYPVVLASASSKLEAAFCGEGALDGMDVKDKIVLCEDGGFVDTISKGKTVKDAGGAGMILINQALEGDSVLADTHVLPAACVGFSNGLKIMAYVNNSVTPTAAFISKGTLLGASPSPMMAAFSSRGPSTSCPGILKPDITGPGVDVLAAWHEPVGPSSVAPTQNFFFNVISGTSMSAPHLSGIAAIIKSAHPSWSPAMIKSAIMTTSDVRDRSGNPIIDEQGKPATFLSMGAGHVNPAKALDPGLVYDIDVADYLKYLCGLGYTSLQMSILVGRPIECAATEFISARELNYPSIMVVLSGMNTTVSVTRKVKNVGEAKAVYSVEVVAPEGVSVGVEPKALEFGAINEETSFTVTFTGGSKGGFGYVEGQLRWVSGLRAVRSPIIVSFA